MKVLRNYWRNMPVKRHAYCYTILEIMSKGYKYKDAKNMVLNSKYLSYVEENPDVYSSYPTEEWANMLIDGYKTKIIDHSNDVTDAFNEMDMQATRIGKVS